MEATFQSGGHGIKSVTCNSPQVQMSRVANHASPPPNHQAILGTHDIQPDKGGQHFPNKKIF